MTITNCFLDPSLDSLDALKGDENVEHLHFSKTEGQGSGDRSYRAYPLKSFFTSWNTNKE